MSNDLFVGFLGKGPELKYTKDLIPVCDLSVGVKVGSGETDWKKVTVWGKQAEDCNLYLKKGSHVFVQGRKRENEYKNPQNLIKRYDSWTADILSLIHS